MREGLQILWSYDCPVDGQKSGENSKPYTIVPAPGETYQSFLLDYEGQLVGYDLKPPRPDAVETAVAILFESAKAANLEYIERQCPQGDSRGILSEVLKVAGQALLRAIDSKSQAMRLEYDTDAAEYRRKRDTSKAEKHFIQNARVPLHRLPLELFSTILIFVHDSYEERDGIISMTSRLRELASVAKHWWRVVLATPQLWTTLRETMPPVHRDWCLRRSKTLPLDIRWERCEVKDFLSTVVPLSERWRSLHFSSYSYSQNLHG